MLPGFAFVKLRKPLKPLGPLQAEVHERTPTPDAQTLGMQKSQKTLCGGHFRVAFPPIPLEVLTKFCLELSRNTTIAQKLPSAICCLNQPDALIFNVSNSRLLFPCSKASCINVETNVQTALWTMKPAKSPGHEEACRC